jgi:glycosyltransferase involved in cell wall biosynthesis
VTAHKLRIGFDYWPAATHAPGIGRYLRELVRALAALEAGPQLALLDVGPEGELLSPSALMPPGARKVLSHRRLRVRRGWLELGQRLLALRAENYLGSLDLFHRARALGAPRARAGEVFALAEFPRADLAEAAALQTALQGFAAVLVFSAAAKQEALRRFALDPARVHQVRVGCDHWLRDAPVGDKARARPRLLVLGAVREHSAHLEVLVAFERLRARGQDADLVFCGRRGDTASRLDGALRASAFRTDVRWVDVPVEHEMPALMASASVLVQLAREAWTPVTALEACAQGVAVVLSRLPCYLEALGDLAEYVEAHDELPIAAGLDAALERSFSSRLDSTSSAARRALAQEFCWERNARETLAVYQQAAREGLQ